jgi:hypothetical protein
VIGASSAGLSVLSGMNTTAAHPTTLRARLIAEGAVEARPGFDTALDADDPFAGDDILWADEDLPQTDDASWLWFFHGLLIAAVLSAVAWLAVAGTLYFAYRLAA